MDCGPLGSSVHEIFQERILEWVAISFSRESSHPRDRTCISCIAGGFFTSKPSMKPKKLSQLSRIFGVGLQTRVYFLARLPDFLIKTPFLSVDICLLKY